MATLEASKARPAPGETWDDARWREQEDAAAAVPEKIGKYWGAKWDNLAESEAVREATPLMSGAVNVAIAGVLLRLALPRIAALQAVGGFDELAEFFGLPPRAELSGYLDQLQGFPDGGGVCVCGVRGSLRRREADDDGRVPAHRFHPPCREPCGVRGRGRGHDRHLSSVHDRGEHELLARKDGLERKKRWRSSGRTTRPSARASGSKR